MSRLTETVIRWFAKLENTRFGGDAVAGFLGFVFFSFTVGVEKLDPRNVGWLTFGDQKAHLLGWLFFSSDKWRWPLGANPRYGWEGMNSIVFTDSWPGLAVFFKFLDIPAVNDGQYFGMGLFMGCIALFVGAGRLLDHFCSSRVQVLLGAGILATTPVFWWMQRWYPALSAGMSLLVWAFLFYFDHRVSLRRFFWRWNILLILAVSTMAYLVVVIVPLMLVASFQRVRENRLEIRNLVVSLGVIAASGALVMFLFGYFTVPGKWAQTGGYGWYSANLLALFDPNGASRLIPDLPSISGQYEPTSLGVGSMLLLIAVLGVLWRLRKLPLSLSSMRRHSPLTVTVLGLSVFAVTNTVSLGSKSVYVPLPDRLEKLLSVFRSSARLIWPLLVLVVLTLLVLTMRTRRSALLLIAALCVQVVDSGHELGRVAGIKGGEELDIPIDLEFWRSVPTRYTVIATHPAQSLGLGWSECAFAAVSTKRIGKCGYFGRLQGLEGVNEAQSRRFFDGYLELDTVYWVSVDWLKSQRDPLLRVFGEDRSTRVFGNIGVLSDAMILVFPNCGDSRSCSFLPSTAETLGEYLHEVS